MPLRNFACTACQREDEYFYHANSDAPAPTCRHCTTGTLTVLDRTNEAADRARRTSSVFPFTTTHIDALGRPMQIDSLSHLRQVERQYGVVLTAFSQNPSNPDGIPDPPRYRGAEWKRFDPRHR